MASSQQPSENISIIRELLEKIDSKIADHGERLAGIAARLEQVAMRSDLAAAIDDHRDTCNANKFDVQSYAKSIGIILGALGVLVGAIAAAYGFTH